MGKACVEVRGKIARRSEPCPPGSKTAPLVNAMGRGVLATLARRHRTARKVEAASSARRASL